MILTISNTSELSDSISSILNILGMPNYSTSVKEALNERGDIYRAILLPEPYIIDDIYSLVNALRSHFLGAKIYKIGAPYTEEIELFDYVIYPTNDEESATYILEELLRKHVDTLPRPLSKITIPRRDDIAIYGNKILLTRTEQMLVRCIALAHPVRLNKDELLRLCLRPGSYTEGAAIRTHISIINKKARQMGYEPIINGEEHGYTINSVYWD